MAFQALEGSPSRLSSHADPEKKSIESGYYAPTEHEKRILDRQLEVAPVKGSYRMLFRYATPTDLFIIFVSSICSIAAGVIFPLMTIVFGSLTTSFSSFQSSHPDVAAFRHEISHLSLYFVYLAIATFVTVYIGTVGFIYTGEHITQKTREQYLAAVLRQNIAYFDKIGAGEITTRITDDMNAIQAGISQKVSLTMSAVTTLVSALIVGFVEGWKLTLILISVVFAMVFSMGAISKLATKFHKNSQEYSGPGATLAEEVFSSIRNATSLGNQERLAQQYDDLLSKAEMWGFRMKSVSGLMLGTMISIMLVDYSLSFWQGARFVISGEMKVGQILTVVLSLMMGSGALGQAAPHFQAFAVAIATSGPIFSVIDHEVFNESTVGKVPTTLQGSIELKSVRHIYPSRPEVVVLKAMDLIIPAGKVTALVGASGSGKSTIVGLLERFYTPVGGQLLLDGEDIQNLDLKWLRRQIALVSQEPVLFGTSVYGNIAHGLIGTELENAPDERKMEMVISAAKMANAHEFISLLPGGYHMIVGERGFLLSGGQKQRIAIARAVISDPRILLLDEATSALDTRSEGVVQAALDAASKGRTTIVIAHRLSTIKGADNIVVMSEGSIVEQGTHSELIKSGGVYLQLIEAQKMTAEKSHAVYDESTSTKEDTTDEETPLDHAQSNLARVATQKSLVGQPGVKPKDHFNNSLWTLIMFIWSLNQSEKWFMLSGFILSIICGSAMPLQAVYMGKEISALTLPHDRYPKLHHDVNFWSLMLFVTAVVIWFAYFGQGVVFGYCSERLIFRARSKGIRHILRQDIAFFDEAKNTSGALVSMLSTEVTHLAGISGVVLGSILSSATSIVMGFIIALAINWKLGLVSGSAMPVLLSCGFLRFWVLSQFEGRVQKVYGDSASYACEATSAIRTIASLTREDQVLEYYHSMLEAQASSSLKSVLKTSTLYAASQGGMLLASALGFWYGGTLIASGELAIEAFFICFIAVTFGAQAAGGIFSHAPDMGKSKQAAESLKNLFDRVPEIDSWSEEGDRIDNVQGALEFRDVHFRYPTRMSQPVLRGINLRFQPGEYVALVGASGCGKSTVISLLERFYNPQSGSILLDGQEISQLNLHDYRSQIALVSQEPVLYSGTIRENILLGSELEMSEEAVVQACKDANIYDFILSLPDGFNTVVGSKGVMLSGGQKQRVAIARALIRNPKILLLDEATSALDSNSEAAVQQALDLASKGRTTISIAHRLSTVQKADVIYVIDKGQVVESGDHESLMGKRGRYYELVSLQGLKEEA